jgi:hypothetical protein
MKKQTILAIFTLLLSVYCASPVWAQVSWDIQTVSEDASALDSYCGIDVDSNGSPHITYTGTPKLGYASWNRAKWNTQKINWGSVYNLVLDADDNPHITFGKLNYGTWNGTQWNFQTITTNYTLYASLTLDSTGQPHVAYISGKTIYYGYLNGSKWAIQAVTTDNNLPAFSKFLSLKLDSNDTPYIMYFIQYFSESPLKLAILKNSSWSIEPILESGNLVSFGNMVLDSNDFPHFIASARRYYGDQTSFLRDFLYIRWNGTDWDAQTVARNVTVIDTGFLTLGPYDYPHIIFAGDGLTYAHWTGVEWKSYRIDDYGFFGPYYNFVVDSKGNPHICYISGSSSHGGWGPINMMYATAELPPILKVSISSPENKTYVSNEIPLTFNTNNQASSIVYSADGSVNVSITENTTLTGLSNGAHSLVVYALDDSGNVGAFDSIHFTVEAPELPLLPIAVIVVLIIVCAFLLIFFKTRKQNSKTNNGDQS